MFPSFVAEQKQKREEGGSVSRKEQRKAKYMKKILDNDKATKLSSFNKRKPTLKKKAFELQTLCDVPVCMVCYDSNGNMDTWPENRHDVISVINGYKKAEEHEKRGGDAIGLLELSKKKLVAKVRENMRKNSEEVAGGLSKLFDGLSGNALADSLSCLDSKLKLIKERMESMLLKVDPCERKEHFFYQVDSGFGHLEDIVLKLENIVESEVGLQVAMVVNEAATLDVSDYLGTMVGSCETLSSVLDSENCNSYPAVGFVSNSDLVPPNCLNSDVGTSYGGVQQDNYLVNYKNLANGFNNFTPFCQTNGLSTPGFHDSQTTSSIGCNNMVGFVDNNNMGLLPLNGFVYEGTSYESIMLEDNYLVNCDLGWLDDLLIDGNDPFCQFTSMPELAESPLGGYTGCSNIAYNFEVQNGGGFVSQPPQ